MRHFSVFGAAAFACALFAGSASATQEPQAADILFERPQLEKLKGGDRLDYSYSFKSADPSLFGPAFDDRIGLRVEPGDGPDKKKVEVEMFSAERRRAAGPFEDMSGNPLLSLMLEENLQRLAAIFQANPRYMKTAIRLALRNAKATPGAVGGIWRRPGLARRGGAVQGRSAQGAHAWARHLDLSLPRLRGGAGRNHRNRHFRARRQGGCAVRGDDALCRQALAGC